MSLLFLLDDYTQYEVTLPPPSAALELSGEVGLFLLSETSDTLLLSGTQ